MTAEEILQSELDKINKGNTTEIQFCYEAIFNAMNEFAESLAKERAVEFAYECLKSMYESIGYSYGIPFMEGKVKEFTEILGKDYDTFLAEKRKEGAE